MKIAIFADTFYPNLGGLEDSTATLARSLGEQGYEVDIYAPRFTDQDFLKRGLGNQEIDLGEKVKVYRLPSLPLPEWLFGTRLVMPCGSGYRFLKKNIPDLIHTQTIFGAGLEALWSSYFLKIPMVGTNHSIISEFGAYFPFAQNVFIKIVVFYETWFYKHCRIVTTPSQSAKQAMEQNGLKSRIEVISNIIDVKTFQPLFDESKKEEFKNIFGLGGRPVISFAGRFAIEKRVEILLRAISILQEKMPKVVLALAGSGIQRANWEKVIKNLAIEDNVKFVGSLSKAQLAKLFQASEAFAIASAIESQGMVVLQAMACAVPVVGVNGRALPEYIKNGSGFVVPIDDFVQISEKLEIILNNHEQAKVMGQVGRQVAEQFSSERLMIEWSRIYQSVLSNK